MNQTVTLPPYSAGTDAYQKIPEKTGLYGKSAVIIGGETALSKAERKIRENAGGLEITGSFVYGKDSTVENAEALMEKPEVKAADMVFAVGGGRAIDTCKYVAGHLHKPLVTFPTVASNCAGVTAIAVLYHPDGSFREYYYCDPAVYCFIDLDIIAHSPEHLLWAGIGDALSKQPEAEYSSIGHDLDFKARLGIQIAGGCTEPLIRYGKQALDEIRTHTAGRALSEVTLDIIIGTGNVSDLVSNVPDYYYNSSIAHMVYYGTTAVNHSHMHGEIVSLGNLILHAYQDLDREMERLEAFSRSIGLPTRFSEIDIHEEDLPEMMEVMKGTTEWGFKSDEVTEEKLMKTMKKFL